MTRVFPSSSGEAGAEEPLANFHMEVVAEIVRDDGAMQARAFEIRAHIANTPRSFELPAAELQEMRWLSRELGAAAIWEARPGIREVLRHATLTLSEETVQRRVYTHTGWRQHGEDWAFLHAGGAIGAESDVAELEVELPAGLDAVELPPPPVGAALEEAIRGSFGVLDVAPWDVTVPLLALTYRAGLGEAHFSAHLYGRSGEKKSSLAALLQAHFGARFDLSALPGSWTSTENALELQAFVLKDVLLTVDDFKLSGIGAEDRALNRKADRLLRAQANRGGRARMGRDGSLRVGRPPRGVILSTGEDLPAGESLRARLLVLEIEAGAVRLEALSRSQANARTGQFAAAMSGWIRWLTGRRGELGRRVEERELVLRREFAGLGGHARTPTMVAALVATLELLVEFATSAGYFETPEAGDRFLADARQAVVQVAAQQSGLQREVDPVEHFLGLLASAISSGRAHVADRRGNSPQNPLAWGWRSDGEGVERRAWGGSTAGSRETWRAQGRRLGWLDGDDLFLDPKESFAVAKQLSAEIEEPLGVSARTLRKRLREAHCLRGTERATRQACTVRRRVSGETRSVLWLAAAALSAEDPQDSLAGVQLEGRLP